MPKKISLYGEHVPSLDRIHEKRKDHAGRKIITIVISMVFILSMVFAMIFTNDADVPAKSQAISVIPGFALLYQHKDTGMQCIPPCGPPIGPWPAHAWNDVSGPNGTYGDSDDCPHCSTFCAPASIAMISTFRGFGAPFTQQDDIYDAGKSTPPEIQANLKMETHGVGMFDGSGGQNTEVQASFFWAVGPFTQHDWVIPNPLTPVLLKQYIVTWHPVLWLDHGGFPVNQSHQYPSESSRMEQGHAKVITGFDDKGTAQFSDDLCLIYDPWPEYDDMSILPVNATMGPTGTYDPYWLPLNDVNLTDIADIYLVDLFPDIPEFTTVLLPITGTLIIAIVAIRLRPTFIKK